VFSCVAKRANGSHVETRTTARDLFLIEILLELLPPVCSAKKTNPIFLPKMGFFGLGKVS
jgi:hypothetical protein